MKNRNLVKFKKLGLFLRYFRKYYGITQKQLAEKINILPQTISKIENGKTGISLSLLFDLTMALDISISKLFLHCDL